MQISTNELRVCIDVDKTLITDIKTQYIEGIGQLRLDYYGQPVYVQPIERHIDLLKSYKSRGYEVTVHSANGYRWAHEVVRKLDLIAFVDRVETKPSKYVDDCDWNNFCTRVFINE